MTLETTVDRSGPYTGNGVTTVFAYTFKITTESHLKVMDITTVGGEVELVSGFTVSGVGADSGGNITFSVAPTTGTIIQPRREVPYTQLTDYQNEAAVRPVQVETDFDLMEMQIQQIVGALGLPFPASRASSYLFFDENGDLTATGTAPNGTYLGAFTTAGEPTTKLSGAALGVGDWYFNTSVSLIKVWNGTAFITALGTGSAIDIVGMTAETAVAVADVFPFYDDSVAANRKITLPNLFKGASVLPDLAASAAVGDQFLVYDISTGLAKNLDTSNLFTSLTGLTALTGPALADELLIRDDSVGGADAARKITPDNFLKVIDLLTVDSTPDLTADWALVYDASASAVKKVQLNKIGAAAASDPTDLTVTTSGTSIDIAGISAGANKIEVMVWKVSTNGSSESEIQLGDAGGIEATGYVSDASDGGGTNSSTTGFTLTRNVSASSTLSGRFVVTRHNGNEWVQSSSVSKNTVSAVGGGSKTLSAELDRIRLTNPGGNTYDGGAISIRVS